MARSPTPQQGVCTGTNGRSGNATCDIANKQFGLVLYEDSNCQTTMLNFAGQERASAAAAAHEREHTRWDRVTMTSWSGLQYHSDTRVVDVVVPQSLSVRVCVAVPGDVRLSQGAWGTCTTSVYSGVTFAM